VTVGATGLWGAATLGCCADRFVVRRQKHFQPDDENHYDDTAFGGDLAYVESLLAQYALIERKHTFLTASMA
jgi:hypothetical protein